MTIYLYKKTHLTTGLKYLGKTTSKNPHSYQGSGKYWKSHIKKHGYNCSTEILKECETVDEVGRWGVYFSELWNVVESDEWANLKTEIGDGGFVKMTKDSIEKRLHTRLERYGTLNTNTQSSILKSIETRKRNGTLNTQTPEVVRKRLDTISKKGFVPRSEESKQTEKATKILNGTWRKSVCHSQESIDKAKATKLINGTNKRSPASIAKALETLKKNGGRTQTPESLEKAKWTKISNGSFIKRACPHCGKLISASPYKRFHGDKCSSANKKGKD
jgi:hypothetical protein